MLISEFIQALESFKAEHGDLPVETWMFGGRMEHKGPELAYRKILSGRQWKSDFASEYEPDRFQGSPVCRV